MLKNKDKEAKTIGWGFCPNKEACAPLTLPSPPRGEGKKLTRHYEAIAEESHTKSCYPEFISGSNKPEIGLQSAKMLKQVQHDIKRVAFTLAEVLIALAIIGVVAALTIPTLIQQQNEKATVTKVKKAYSVLSQAFEMAEIDNGSVSTWASSATDYENFAKPIVEQLNVTKDCGLTTDEDCWSESLSSLSGSSAGNTNSRSAIYKFQTADGMSMYVGLFSADCSKVQGSSDALSSICGWVGVDITGPSKPNIIGKDYFAFSITKYGIIPGGVQGLDSDLSTSTFEKSCKPTSTGEACAAWVVYNENMDYLKCPDDLSWDGNHKCP